MTSNQPGDRRQLAEPPSARYAERGPAADAAGRSGASALPGPLLRAIVSAMLGSAALVFVGAILASTFGLLFVGGGTGAAIGLLLARAAVPGDEGAGRPAGRPVPRATVIRFAIGLALLAVVVADVGTWLFAAGEGGTLGLLDYLWTTFGPFVPGVAVIAAITAAWGASAGPVQR